MQKRYNPSYTTSRHVLGRERIEILCQKSYWLFKYKWHWRKLVETKGITVDELEKEFDKVIAQQNEKLELMKKLQEEADEGKEVRSTEAGPESVAKGE